MSGPVAAEELRLLVREALREFLAAPSGETVAPAPQPAGLVERVREGWRRGGSMEVQVVIRSDEDLQTFARDVAALSGDRDMAQAVRRGAVRFRLVGTVGAGSGGESPGETAEWSEGLLNERKLVELAKTCRRLVLGPKAVVTPLARDRARQIGLELVRSRP
jgi:hypothetical protein